MFRDFWVLSEVDCQNYWMTWTYITICCSVFCIDFVVFVAPAIKNCLLESKNQIFQKKITISKKKISKFPNFVKIQKFEFSKNLLKKLKSTKSKYKKFLIIIEILRVISYWNQIKNHFKRDIREDMRRITKSLLITREQMKSATINELNQNGKGKQVF